MFETGSNDHYFPQWLLKHWCDDRNEIWCFDKKIPRIKKKAPTCLAKEQDLNKSNLGRIDLESTIFAELDNRHSTEIDVALWQMIFGTNQRVPNRLCHSFIELAIWTSMRNKRAQEWGYIDSVKEALRKDGLAVHAQDEELRKAIHLRSCKMILDDGTVSKEIERLKREFFYFFVLSENRKIITSDMPVQELGSGFAEDWMGCHPTEDDECALILFPIYPEVLFVATRHQEFQHYHRHLVFDDRFIDLNYTAHIDSSSEELYFPYRVYAPVNVPRALPPFFAKKTEGVPCAIDLEYRSESGGANIIYSNWAGGAN